MASDQAAFTLLDRCFVKLLILERRAMSPKKHISLAITSLARVSLATMCVLLPSIALASTALASGSESEDKGGLPQLDFATWPTQLFWLFITFTLAYILMARLVMPKIGGVLDKRAAKISADLDQAKQADAEAKSTFLSYEKALSDARGDAAAQAAAAMTEAKATAQIAEAEMAKKLGLKIKSAEAELGKMRVAAMANLEDIASEATSQAVAHLIGITPEKAALNKHVKQAAKSVAAH